MNVLRQIIEHKKREVEQIKSSRPLARLPERADEIRDFPGALRGDHIRIIAEIKRQSPSGGEILGDADPAEVAAAYQANGAAAISVLTDAHYFGGSLGFLADVRSRIDLPVLRKDFILDEYQIWESYHAGADAILLILEALDFPHLRRLYRLASELGLHALVESYSDENLQLLKELRPAIAGINARNLATMDLDFPAMLQKYHSIPGECIAVAESGIVEPAQLVAAEKAGFDAALIGTAFMRTGEPGKTLKMYQTALDRI